MEEAAGSQCSLGSSPMCQRESRLGVQGREPVGCVTPWGEGSSWGTVVETTEVHNLALLLWEHMAWDEK